MQEKGRTRNGRKVVEIWDEKGRIEKRGTG